MKASVGLHKSRLVGRPFRAAHRYSDQYQLHNGVREDRELQCLLKSLVGIRGSTVIRIVGHSFFSTPDGERTYLVELKTDPPVRVTARLEKLLGKVHWTAIKESVKRGRPFSARHDYHAKLWAPRFLELDSELNDPAGLNGDRALSRIGLGYLVACEDYKEHPGRWDYDPDANALTRKSSGQRVWKAVKPLI